MIYEFANSVFNNLFGKKVALAHLGLLSAIKDEDYSRSRQLCEEAGALPRMYMEERCIHDILLGLVISACAEGDDTTARQHLQTIFRYSVDNRDWEYALMALPLAALLLAREGEHEQAVTLLALAFTASPITGWLEHWSLVTRLRTQLEADLGKEAYVAAWERGGSLNVETVASERLAAYEDRV